MRIETRLSGFSLHKKKPSEGADPFVVMLWVSALFGAALIGIALGLGIYPVAIALLAMMAGFALIAYPVVGMWVVIVGALVGAGLVDLYMPSLKPLVWGLALLSMGIAVIALVKAFFGQARTRNASTEGAGLVIWALIFILCAIFSSLANWHGVSGFLVGLKGYFQVWGLLIAIYYLTKDEHDARRLISFFLLLGILQLPLVLHQFLMLVPQRSGDVFAAHGIVAGDIVAGTFGGSMMGGGRSSTLALLSVICVTIMLARWRSELSTAGRAVLATLFFLLPMFFSEAKLFLVLFPIALFLLFRGRILRNPLKSIAGAATLGALLTAIFFAYSLLLGAKSQHVSSLQKMLQQNIEYNIGKRGYGNAMLNRSTVYPFWLKEHAHGDMLVPALIGHGPGATSGGTALNDDSLAYKHYRGYGIGLTGLSSLLWEVGLLGTTAVLAMLFSAYRLGGRLVERWIGTVHWPALKVAQIAVPLFAVSLLHNNYFVFDLSFQSMLVVVLGYLLAMARFDKSHASI